MAIGRIAQEIVERVSTKAIDGAHVERRLALNLPWPGCSCLLALLGMTYTLTDFWSNRDWCKIAEVDEAHRQMPIWTSRYVNTPIPIPVLLNCFGRCSS